MDFADKGSLNESIHRSLSLDQLKRRAANHRLGGTIECLDCGEEIPISRRRAVPGCELCLSCQREREARDRRVP